MPPSTITTGPAELVSMRMLTAEAAASSALALVQCSATWASLATLALMQEAAAEYAATNLGGALADLLAGAATTPSDTASAVHLLETLDRTARTWAALAHPGARTGINRTMEAANAP